MNCSTFCIWNSWMNFDILSHTLMKIYRNFAKKNQNNIINNDKICRESDTILKIFGNNYSWKNTLISRVWKFMEKTNQFCEWIIQSPPWQLSKNDSCLGRRCDCAALRRAPWLRRWAGRFFQILEKKRKFWKSTNGSNIDDCAILLPFARLEIIEFELCPWKPS